MGEQQSAVLAFAERDYIACSPFDGERDARVRCHQTTLRRARQRWVCFGLLGEQEHEIQPGDLYVHEKGIAYDRWGSNRLCIGCMDKWLTELGRPTRSERQAADTQGGE